MLFRFLQGFGQACTNTTCKSFLKEYSFIVFSLVSLEFPQERERYYGYVESATGVGLLLGPVIGQALYTLLGFANTFYVTSVVFIFPLIMQMKYIPDRIDRALVNEHKDKGYLFQ